MPSEKEFLAQIAANQGIIYKLVGLYADSDEDRKDLYQEILLQAWRAYGSFRGEAKFSTWLYRVSLNTILTSQRKRQLTDYREELAETAAVEAAAPHATENARLLRQAIRQLPETDRAIISLHLDGYANPEISEIMGITVNHVGVKLHRIKNHLITILQPT